MKLSLRIGALLLCGALATPALWGRDKDWREKLDPVAGQPWLPMPLGRAVYHFGWSGFKAAEAELVFSQKEGIAQLESTGRTVGGARLLFRMDCRGLALSDLKQSRPIRTRHLEEYGDRSVVEGAEFGEKTVTFSRSRREGGGIPDDLLIHRELDRETMRELTGQKGKRAKFPGMIDLQSALFYLRAQRLTPGEKIRFVVFHGTAPYRVDLKVGKPETIKTATGEHRAIPVNVKLSWIDKKQRLQNHKNFRSATGWFSDDPTRMLLKVESEIFVGKIWAELVSFTPEG